MTPIVKSLPSYIKDSNHALEIFRNFNFSGENKIIFTMDITSLYTVIPNNEGLQALKHFFNQRPIKKPISETLLRLAELVLTPNCFSFGDNHYKQINGVAMGTKMGPSYANLFVGFIENKFFSNYHGPKPDLYKRYIDDCVGATSSSKEELKAGFHMIADDRRRSQIPESSAIVCDHMETHFCDRLRSCDRDRRRSQTIAEDRIFLILTDDSTFLSHKARTLICFKHGWH